MLGKKSTSKAAKVFLDYIKKHNLPFENLGDSYDADVLIKCDRNKFYDFCEKLANKFECKLIVTPQSQMVVPSNKIDAEVKLYDDYID